jgi:hypothetical protein
MNSTITEDFILKTGQDAPDFSKASPSQKKIWFALEEAILNAKINSHINSPVSAGLESEIIAFMESYSDKSTMQERDAVFSGFITKHPDMAIPVQQIFYAMSRFSATEDKKVPQALMNLIEYDYKKSKESGKQSETVPAMVIRIAQGGLEIVKSTLQGFTVQEVTAVSMRSAAALAQPPRNTRIQLEQTISSSEDPRIIYNLIQETRESITLSISILNNPGKSRIDLKQDGQIMDSVNVQNAETTSANFSHLSPGFYEVDIRGALNRSFGILIQSESE